MYSIYLKIMESEYTNLTIGLRGGIMVKYYFI